MPACGVQFLLDNVNVTAVCNTVVVRAMICRSVDSVEHFLTQSGGS